jgi:hypothetical protein
MKFVAFDRSMQLLTISIIYPDQCHAEMRPLMVCWRKYVQAFEHS